MKLLLMLLDCNSWLLLAITFVCNFFFFFFFFFFFLGFNMLPIYAEMKKIADEKKNFSVLIPEDLPEELHYR